MFVQSTALVESTQIGEGSRIWAYTHIMSDVIVGKDCNIGSHCFIESGAKIGDQVTIKNGNMIWDGVTLEDGVFVGPQVVFTNDRYPRSPRLPYVVERYEDTGWLLPTLIQTGASLGAGAILLPGIRIGAYATVGAGSVVTRDVPAHALVTGNPARVRSWVCLCGQPLLFKQDRARCDDCDQSFVKNNDMVRIHEAHVK